ncbi:hypothetical protein [Nocardioides sp.]|uniref:hypothetical protein n=1 Tax=Nocardioides sp. TaxID=35761 RepID=UPI002736AE74|nr:hypothetical protein [Nocardioides sp.]MDP3893907.1 hypothetical protein [Nocardioides sp.]
MSESSTDIPTDSLRYFCSNCGGEFNSHYGVQRHIDKTDCKAAGGRVRVVRDADVKAKLAEYGLTDKSTADEQQAAIDAKLEPSLAEQASAEPPWANVLTEEDIEQAEESDLPERDIPPFRLRIQQATLNIQPEAWLVVAYESALRDGYVGSLSDWVHESIVYLFILKGVKIEVLATPPSERERILEEAGLVDARA